MKIANTRNVSNLATASYNTVRSGGKFSAIAVCGTVDGKQVQLCSLPAHLNGNKLPGLRDLRGMIEGRSIVAAAYAIRTEPSRRIAADAQVRILGRAASVLDIVVIRARFGAMQDAHALGHRVDADEHFDVMCASWSDDKAVHAIEDAAYQMRLEANAVYGNYADHKAKFAPAPAVSLVKKVNLAKRPAPALQFAAPVFVDNRTNEQVMLDTLALLRQKRLALSTVYTVESDGVNMGSYLAESKPAALDACARAHAFASFAHMETSLGRTLNFDVFAEFVNPLTGRVPA